MKDSKKTERNKSAAAQNTVRVAENWLWQFMNKDLGGYSDPTAICVISGYAPLFLWSYVGAPGHTQDHSCAEHTLTVPSALLTDHEF